MLELELTQCEYDNGCHLVDTFFVSRAVEQKSLSLTKPMSFSKLLWCLRVEREILISKFKVVDKSLSSSLCSISTQRVIWFPYKLKKASMMIICCTKTPLFLSPYLCYFEFLLNFFQCWHLSFSDRSPISSNQRFQFLSSSFGEIYDLISAAMIWSRVPETALQPEANLSSV